MDKVDHLKCQKYIVPSQPVTCLLNRSLGRVDLDMGKKTPAYWFWSVSDCSVDFSVLLAVCERHVLPTP